MTKDEKTILKASINVACASKATKHIKARLIYLYLLLICQFMILDIPIFLIFILYTFLYLRVPFCCILPEKAFRDCHLKTSMVADF
jgi:hypothetical protein